MNPKRILVAIIVAFVLLSASGYLIHQVWLKSTYAPDAGKLWRPEADIQAHMTWIIAGHLMAALAFAMVWARITMGGAGLPCALTLGFLLGLLNSASAVMQGAVQPLPEGLVTKWITADLVQGLLVGLVLFLVYPPTKACPEVTVR